MSYDLDGEGTMSAIRPGSAISEATIQRSIVQMLQHAARGDVIWFHCPNGEARDAVTGARLKSLGVRRGVADLVFVLPGGRAAFLELKRGGGRMSPDQRMFASDCERIGALHAVASNIDDAVERLRAWGVLKVTTTRITTAAACRGAGDGAAGSPAAPDLTPQTARVLGVPA